VSPGTGVELRGGPSLSASKIGVGAVYQLWPVHDGEVPGVTYRKQHVRHADVSEVPVRRGLLECVGENFITLCS